MPALGRKVPTDWQHYEKYPLSAAQVTRTVSPIVWGINWYEGFDDPVQASDGRWWVPRSSLGSVQGGHAIASPVAGLRDYTDWQVFYDQGSEPKCVGFSISRMATWLNRKRYDAHWLYDRAQDTDEWPGDDYDGTSVRAGLGILKSKGHRVWRNGTTGPVTLGEGISAFRWLSDANEAIRLLGHDYGTKHGAIPWNNSWGKSYPRTVWVPGETIQRLIDEDGEAAVSTDR